jgi:hypothetical protein
MTTEERLKTLALIYIFIICLSGAFFTMEMLKLARHKSLSVRLIVMFICVIIAAAVAIVPLVLISENL